MRAAPGLAPPDAIRSPFEDHGGLFIRVPHHRLHVLQGGIIEKRLDGDRVSKRVAGQMSSREPGARESQFNPTTHFMSAHVRTPGASEISHWSEERRAGGDLFAECVTLSEIGSYILYDCWVESDGLPLFLPFAIEIELRDVSSVFHIADGRLTEFSFARPVF